MIHFSLYIKVYFEVMMQSISNFLIIFFIFQQLRSKISQIDQNGYKPFCDEPLHLLPFVKVGQNTALDLILMIFDFQVGPLSTLTTTQCLCSHLSFFGSSLLVPPNKINIFSDAKLFLTFADNPIVVTFVAAILVGYVGVVVLARRKDKRDEALVNIELWPHNVSKCWWKDILNLLEMHVIAQSNNLQWVK